MTARLTFVSVALVFTMLTTTVCEAQILRRIIERRAAAREAAAEQDADPAARDEIAREEPVAAAPRLRRLLGLPPLGEPETADANRSNAAVPNRAQSPAGRRLPNSSVEQAEFQDPTLGIDPDVLPASGTVPNLTAIGEELTAMGPPALLGMLQQWNQELERELENFTTAESWQNYLVLSPQKLAAARTQPAVVIEAQQRFDGVVGNPEYEQISSLHSFWVMHRILRQLSSLAEGPQLVGPSLQQESAPAENAEALPVPEPASRPTPSEGERSILLRD